MDVKDMTIDFASMFAAGAATAAKEHGMSEKDAEAFVGGLCKEAARGRFNFEDMDDEGDETFWSRNKGWLIPAIVGSLAFYAGADGERHGRLDRGYLSNTGNRIWDRLKTLFGYGYDPIYRAATATPKGADVAASRDDNRFAYRPVAPESLLHSLSRRLSDARKDVPVEADI